MYYLPYFSSNLIDYVQLDKNEIAHNWGDVLTFHGSLTAIGGLQTTKVEVFHNEIWNQSIIQPVPEPEVYCYFSSLVIEDFILLFGNYHI